MVRNSTPAWERLVVFVRLDSATAYDHRMHVAKSPLFPGYGASAQRQCFYTTISEEILVDKARKASRKVSVVSVRFSD